MTVEDAKSLQQNVLWEALCKEIDGLIDARKERLTTCHTDEVYTLQAEIKVYRAIKRLPQDIVDREAESF